MLGLSCLLVIRFYTLTLFSQKAIFFCTIYPKMCLNLTVKSLQLSMFPVFLMWMILVHFNKKQIKKKMCSWYIWHCFVNCIWWSSFNNQPNILKVFHLILFWTPHMFRGWWTKAVNFASSIHYDALHFKPRKVRFLPALGTSTGTSVEVIRIRCGDGRRISHALL